MEAWAIVLIVIGSVLLFFLLVWFLLGYIFAKKTFSRRPKKFKTKNALDLSMAKQYDWMDDIKTEDLSINSEVKNTKLTAKLYVNPTPNHIYIITVHGFHGMYKSRSIIMKKLLEKYKFNFIAINMRGHDTSEGKYHTLGYFESIDLKEWINYVIKMDPDCKIILDGVSMGSFTVMRSLQYYSLDKVIGAVCDCGYDNIGDQIKYEYTKIAGVFGKIIYITASIFLRLKVKQRLENISTEEALRNNDIPLLFFHSKEDKIVPFECLNKNASYVKSTTYKKIVVFESGQHARAFVENEDEYFKNYENFLNYCLDIK